MNSPNRRKICQIQIQKEAYQRHINRLEQLKDGCSPQQLRRNREQKKLVQTLNTMRKMHTYNRQYRQRQMKQIELESKQTDFNKIKSVVTHDFNRPIPSIAPKHKRSQKPIFNQNLKIFQRIINTKSNVKTQNLTYTQRKSKPLPYISPNDFSKLYQTSRLNTNDNRLIKIRLGRSKKNKKVQCYFNLEEIFQCIKDLDSMYLIQVQCDQLKARSQSFIVRELQATKITVKIPQKLYLSQIIVKIIKILDIHEKKQVVRARLVGLIENKKQIDLDQLQKQNINYQTYSSNHTPRKSKQQQQQKYQTTGFSSVLGANKFVVKLRLCRDNKFYNHFRETQHNSKII